MWYGYTIDYCLDGLSFSDLMMLYEFGLEFHAGYKRVDKDPTPDKEAFYKRYRDKIKRGEVE